MKHSRAETTQSFGLLMTYCMLGTFALFSIYPIIWLLINSFKTTQEFYLNRLGLPGKIPEYGWTLVNFITSWKAGNFSVLIVNSAVYTMLTVFATLLFSLMTGFAFAKLHNTATPFLHGTYIIGLLLTIQSIMVPLFLLINWTGLYNTRIGILIPYIGIALPLAVYLATEFIKGIPSALIESARIDGAPFFTIFYKIIVPMSAPVATTIAIFTTTATWNEFMLINILTSEDRLKSLPVGIQQFSGTLSTDFCKQFAALTIGMLPILIFYLVFRKEITKGISAGAVKG
ncbi:MAG: carbohydrate ABC transporter permease [Treponema sp.]